MTDFSFEPDANAYSAENAYWLGSLASLAYWRAADVERRLGELGLTRFQFVSGRRTDTQAFVAANKKAIIVAFRGTEPTRHKDWLTDAKFRLVDGVHRGFKEAFDEVWGEVAAALEKFKGKRLSFQDLAAGKRVARVPGLWFTGHSLGAALAALGAARMLAEDQPVAGVYTFGQPRTGSREWAAWYNTGLKARTFRFVNNNDVVTRVPLRAMTYSHVGSFRYFDADGKLHADMSLWQRFLDRVHGRIEDFLELGPDGLKDHSMDAYLRGLEAQRGA